jgi:hypothetical protein
MRILLLLACAATLVGEVPGIPRMPRPGLVPDYWFHLGNDLFSPGDNVDDFRTADIAAGARLFDRLLISVNYSILTNRHQSHWGMEQWTTRFSEEFLYRRLGLPPPEYPGRIDQLTATVGGFLWRSVDEEHQLVHQLAAGAGIRLYGYLYGDIVQNNLHRFSSIETVELAYEDWTDLQAVGYLSGHLSQSFDLPLADGGGWLPATVPLGYWIEAQALATDDGQLEGDYGAYGGLVHRLGAVWLGLRYQVRDDDGYGHSPTAAGAADNDRGLHGVVGLGVGSFYLESGYRFGNRRGFGRVGIVISSEQINLPELRTGQRLTGGIDFLAPDFGLGAQLRWYPFGVEQDRALRLDPALTVHLRQSQVHNGDYVTHDLSGRQCAAGIDLELPLPAPFQRLRPFVAGGLGWRQEIFTVNQDWRQYGIQKHASATTTYGDAGMRFYLRQPVKGLHATVHAGLTAWAPWHEGTWWQGVNRVRFLRAGADGLLGFSFDYLF